MYKEGPDPEEGGQDNWKTVQVGWVKGAQGGGPSRGANNTRNSTMRVGQETGWWGGPRGWQLPPDCVPGCDSV